MLVPNYGTIRTTNSIAKSMEVIISTEPYELIRNRPKATILCFKQSEKDRLIKMFPQQEVGTVAENEGITRTEVVLVRLDTADNHLYMPLLVEGGCSKMNPHQLVGVTRHTHKLTYITPKMDFLSFLHHAHTKYSTVYDPKGSNLFNLPDVAGEFVYRPSTPSYYRSAIAHRLTRKNGRINFNRKQATQIIHAAGTHTKTTHLAPELYANKTLETQRRVSTFKDNGEIYNAKYKPIVEYGPSDNQSNDCWFEVQKFIWGMSGITTAAAARREMKVPLRCMVNFQHALQTAAFLAEKKITSAPCTKIMHGYIHLFQAETVHCNNCIKFELTDDHVERSSTGNWRVCMGRSLTHPLDKLVGRKVVETTTTLITKTDLVNYRNYGQGTSLIVKDVDHDAIRFKEHEMMQRQIRSMSQKSSPVSAQAIEITLPFKRETQEQFDQENSYKVNVTNGSRVIFTKLFTDEDRERRTKEYIRTNHTKPATKRTTRVRLPNTTRTITACVLKRNMATPKLQNVTITDELINHDVEEFLRIYTVNGNNICDKVFKNCQIAISGGYMKEWFERQNRNMDKSKPEIIWDIDCRKYKLAVKTITKTYTYEPNKNVTGQTIHEHNKTITAEYSSLIRQAMERLIGILRPQYAMDLYFTDAEREMWFDTIPPAEPTEIDVSAFDKSQGLYHNEFFIKLLIKLGVPPEYAEYWRRSQFNKKSTTRDGAMSIAIMMQTASGDGTTISKNVISLMNALKYIMERGYGIFKGDDLIGFNIDRSYEKLSQVCTKHNFEMKLVENNEMAYYCGHFVYFKDGRWKLMKDIIKRMDSLSMGIEPTLLLDHYVSLIDWLKTIDSDDIEHVTTLCYNRTGYDAGNYYNYLKHITQSAEHFAKHHNCQIPRQKRGIPLVRTANGLDIPMKDAIIRKAGRYSYHTVIKDNYRIFTWSSMFIKYYAQFRASI